MNAFHPDYMKVYHPGFWTEQVLASRSSQAMTAYIEKKRRDLKPLAFLVYSRPGMPK